MAGKTFGGKKIWGSNFFEAKYFWLKYFWGHKAEFWVVFVNCSITVIMINTGFSLLFPIFHTLVYSRNAGEHLRSNRR